MTAAVTPLHRGSGLSTMILDAVSSLVLVTDAETGLVVDLNKPAELVTGYPRDQIIGRPLWELVAPDQREMVRLAFEDAGGGGFPLTYESSVNLRSGHPSRVVWSSTYLTDAAGVQTHVVMTGIDISAVAASGGLFGHLMLAANTTALISTDIRGRVTYCSSGAEQMLGLLGDEMVGELLPLAIFEPTEFLARADEQDTPPDLALLTVRGSNMDRRSGPKLDLGQLDRRGRGDDRGPESRRSQSDVIATRDWTLVRADGSRLLASVTISLVRDPHGQHVGYVGVAHDVTERGRANQLLAAALEKEGKAIERLHELDSAKSDFVATVSHELRTPTTSICGYTELLLDGLVGELTPEQSKLVDTVRRNSERLIALADDLLTLARSDAGDLTFDLLDLDLRDVFSSAEDAWRPLVADRELATVIEVPSEPVWIVGDARHLERVLLNLVSNAVKFTEPGGSVSCRLTVEAGEAVLAVSDTGIGIPLEEQGDLFTRFFRSSTAQARAIPGTGLGLAIVSSIVGRHGGTISVESEHLIGSTFSVRLPLAPTSGSDS